jgi:hypothetical protein
MIRGDLVGQVSIRFVFELIHYYAKDTPTFFSCAPRRSLHHTKITPGANSEASLRKPSTEVPRFPIFIGILGALRAAKDRNDTVSRIIDHSLRNMRITLSDALYR